MNVPMHFADKMDIHFCLSFAKRSLVSSTTCRDQILSVAEDMDFYVKDQAVMLVTAMPAGTGGGFKDGLDHAIDRLDDLIEGASPIELQTINTLKALALRYKARLKVISRALVQAANPHEVIVWDD
jgi:hypothetical protein